MAEIPGSATQHVTITDDYRRNRLTDTALAVALDKIEQATRQALAGWPVGKGARVHLALCVERPDERDARIRELEEALRDAAAQYDYIGQHREPPTYEGCCVLAERFRKLADGER